MGQGKGWLILTIAAGLCSILGFLLQVADALFGLNALNSTIFEPLARFVREYPVAFIIIWLLFGGLFGSNWRFKKRIKKFAQEREQLKGENEQLKEGKRKLEGEKTQREEEKKKIENQLIISQPKRVALFVPRSNRSGYFWEQFEIEVIYSLSEKGYYCCLAALNGEYIPENQITKLDKFNWNEIQGAIIAPAGIEVLPDIARRIIEGRRVVLHDVTPETWRHYFVGEGLRAPDYVTVKNEIGGRLAARIMKVYFETFGVEKTDGSYNVIYIPGGDRYPHSNERVSGFKSEWEMLSQYKVRPLPTPDGNWIASDARNACAEFLKVGARDPKLNKIDGIFACNDEMAFAAMHLLDSVKLDADIDPKLVARTIIVGFDAIPLARSELKNKRSRFIGTIDAKIEEQAQFVARYLGESIEQPLEDYTKRKTKSHEVIPKVLPNEMFAEVEPKGLTKVLLNEIFRKEE